MDVSTRARVVRVATGNMRADLSIARYSGGYGMLRHAIMTGELLAIVLTDPAKKEVF